MKLQRRHINRIRELFKDRFTLEEIHMAYKGLIPYNQLRNVVRGVKKVERI
jgi:hypothetical protein